MTEPNHSPGAHVVGDPATSTGWLRQSLWGLIALTLGMGAACFTDTPVPPTFRFQCASDSECEQITGPDGEVLYAQSCISGLCQYACQTDLLASQSDCPPNEGFLGCFNGVCTHLCDQTDRLCSAPQACQTGTIPPEFAAMLGGAEEIGLCGIACDDADAPDCPDGQSCFEGICIDLSGLTTGSDSDTDTGTGTDPTTGG
ncbi:MAG: hypothetical protein ACPG77_03885 [Nannocystaceae bacterium]